MVGPFLLGLEHRFLQSEPCVSQAIYRGCIAQIDAGFCLLRGLEWARHSISDAFIKHLSPAWLLLSPYEICSNLVNHLQYSIIYEMFLNYQSFLLKIFVFTQCLSPHQDFFL